MVKMPIPKTKAVAEKMNRAFCKLTMQNLELTFCKESRP